LILGIYSIMSAQKNSVKYAKVTKKELELIKSIVGPERVSTGESVLSLHSKDESFHPRRRPKQ